MRYDVTLFSWSVSSVSFEGALFLMLEWTEPGNCICQGSADPTRKFKGHQTRNFKASVWYYWITIVLSVWYPFGRLLMAISAHLDKRLWRWMKFQKGCDVGRVWEGSTHSPVFSQKLNFGLIGYCLITQDCVIILACTQFPPRPEKTRACLLSLIKWWLNNNNKKYEKAIGLMYGILISV